MLKQTYKYWNKSNGSGADFKYSNTDSCNTDTYIIYMDWNTDTISILESNIFQIFRYPKNCYELNLSVFTEQLLYHIKFFFFLGNETETDSLTWYILNSTKHVGINIKIINYLIYLLVSKIVNSSTYSYTFIIRFVSVSEK